MSAAPRAGDDVPVPSNKKDCDTTALVRASNDARLESRIGQTLRTGVTASTVCLAVGLVVSLFTPYDAAAQWLMVAGLVLLMATPVARVAATVVEYAVERDWPFFVLTSIVLVELAAGVVAALVMHRRF
jgi:uncharacterized membrane protein